MSRDFQIKQEFFYALTQFVSSLDEHVSTDDGQWRIFVNRSRRDLLWKIASDKSGSGNTANIGSINKIGDIVSERGMFSDLGEEWFDDYWMNYDKITITEESGKTKQIRNLKDFVAYRGGDVGLIVPKARKIGLRRNK